MVKTIVIAGIDEHKKIDKTGEVKFLMKLKNLPKKFVNLAKKIDGENYEPDCFGFEYSYNIGSKTFTVNKKNGYALYYLDEEGDRHYMDYEIPQNIETVAVKKCNKVLQQEGIKKKRKSPSIRKAEVARSSVKQSAEAGKSCNTGIKLTILIGLVKGKKKFVSGQYSIFTDY